MPRNRSALRIRDEEKLKIRIQILAWLFAAAGAFAALFIARSTLGMIRAGVFRAPVWDQWYFLNRARLWETGKESFWKFLWQQHNEHRMVLNFLILIIDRELFAARGTFALACAWIFQVLHAVLWCWIYWKEESSAASRTAYAALITGAFFSAAQFQNFLWPFQANFIAVFFLASMAIACFLIHCRRHSKTFLAMAIMLAVAATFSMANGMLLWPIFLLMAMTEKSPQKTMLMVLAVGATVLASYLCGYATPVQHANPLLSILHPKLLTGYLGIYFINSLARMPAFATPVRAGLFIEAFFTASFAGYLWKRAQGRAQRYAFYAYSSLFLFGTALLTAMGRINLGWAQAESSRYNTPIFLFWMSFGSAACLLLGSRKTRAWRTLGPPALSAVILMGMLLPRQTAAAYLGAEWVREMNISGLSLAVGAFDPEAWHRLSDPGTIEPVLPYLESRRLSIFSDPDVEKIGVRLATVLKPLPARRCLGSFSGFIAVPSLSPGGVAGRVFGEGWMDSARTNPIETVYIADGHGTIVGLAYGFRPAKHFFKAEDPLRGKWGGYVLFKRGTRRLFAYGVLPGAMTACPLGSTNPRMDKRLSAKRIPPTD